MKTFDVQSIAIEKPADTVFEFVADPANLPKWTNAFKSADAQSAMLETPGGTVSIKLETVALRDTGTVDWKMSFPDGTVGTAFSRITPDGENRSIYSFVLMAPPVPLKMLEGALTEQMAILARELIALKARLEA
jgi:hypothetical protein